MDIEFDATGRTLRVSGPISEESDFASLVPRLSGEVVMDLAGVTRINSSGVRRWVNFTRTLPSDVHLVLERCPVTFVDQMNVVAGFRGRADVRSVFVPYICLRCELPREQEVDVQKLYHSLPSPPTCERCGGTTMLDALEDQYFDFLKQLRS